ncbi:DUF4439 domain-containing protein [Kineococcus endophyticus]
MPPVPPSVRSTGRETSVRRPSRRALLGTLALAAAAPALAGCGVRWVVGDEPTPTAERGPDDVAREAAVDDTLTLLTVLDTAAGGPAPLQAVAAQAAQVCRAHLTALGAPALATSAGAATPSGTTPDAQVVADRLTQASTAAVTELAPAQGRGPGPDTARLLVAVAASRAVLADAVAVVTGAVVRPAQDTTAAEDAAPGTATAEPTSAAPTGTAATPSPTGPSPTGTAATTRVRALQAALAGEHAAVYAYALVAGRLAAPRRDEALADLDAHRVARDDLVDELTAVGATPVEAAAGYDVAARTAAAATALAAAVEERVTALRADVVAGAGTGRAEAAATVLTAARAARRWGSTVLAFPGLPWLGEDGRAVPGAATAPSTDGPSTASTP